jgi:tRNA-dihydrouridine synthase
VLSVPVVANGGVENFEDIPRCLAATRADGVMSSEAALENPAVNRL